MFYTIKLKAVLPRFAFFIINIFAIAVALHYNNLETALDEHTASYVDHASISPLYADTLIIDAGHGGEDGGAVSSGTVESVINLQIAKRLEQISGLWGVPVVMTRENDDIIYPGDASTTKARKTFDQKQRVSLINSIPDSVLVSIHQNKFTAEQPSGVQVLYGRVDGSLEFGEIAHENLVKCLNPGSRRVAAPISESIFLMRMVECPAILVECGFLSNNAERELLESSDYQVKIAAILLTSYIQWTGQQQTTHK